MFPACVIAFDIIYNVDRKFPFTESKTKKKKDGK